MCSLETARGGQILCSALIHLLTEPRSRPTMTTSAELVAQWANPAGLAALAMLLGSEIVHNALAQSAGTRFALSCFSFGWVTYSFSALSRVFGDGRLLPPPDSPVKLFNLSSGTVRNNENWVVGRLMRDLEAHASREYPMFCDGIRITVFEAGPKAEKLRRHLPHNRMHLLTLFVVLIQLGIASIPWGREGDWAIFFITITGIFAASCFGSLPQWAAEKLPERQDSQTCFALTRGKGFKDVVVILGAGNCLDLDELAAADSPRNWRLWRKFQKPKPDVPATGLKRRTASFLRRAYILLGEPLQLWLTRFAALVHAMVWLFILTTIAGLRSNMRYVLGISALGTIANLIIIGTTWAQLNSRILPLHFKDVFMERRDSDGIRALEDYHKCGGPLLAEFAPGESPRSEDDNWDSRAGHDKEQAEMSSSASLPVSSVSPRAPNPVGQQDRSIDVIGNRPHDQEGVARLDTVLEKPENNKPGIELGDDFGPAGKSKGKAPPSSRSSQESSVGNRFSMEEASPTWG